MVENFLSVRKIMWLAIYKLFIISISLICACIALKAWIYFPVPLVDPCSAARDVVAGKACTAIAVFR